MSLVKSGMSAIGRLLVIVVLLGAFLCGMAVVVIYSLRGEEIQVPEIVGKDFGASEKELAALGLKIKKRATRYSQEAPNTVLEQSPKPGETVKTGIPIFVTIARSNTEGDETPFDIDKTDTNTNLAKDADDDNAPVNTALTKKDKPKKDPKKANTNANTSANKAGSSANSAGGDNKNSGASNNSGTPAATPKPNTNTARPTGAANKPVAARTPPPPADGRSRRTP